jgi:hypothetical protein
MTSTATNPQAVDNLSTGVAMNGETMNTKTNAPIILTDADKPDNGARLLAVADTMNKVTSVYSYGDTVESVTSGQYYEERLSTKIGDLGGELYALTVLRYFIDLESGLEAESMEELNKFANVFVTREHAHKFALAILAELEADNN